MDFIFFAAELSGGTLAVDVGAYGVVGAIDPQNPSPPPPSKFQLDLIDPQNPPPPRPTKLLLDAIDPQNPPPPRPTK